MELWQIVLITFFVLLPMALLLDFWPHRERLSRTGAPVPREWDRQITHEPHDDEHH
ncbi:hypothetical protein [Nitriliruptor alkaliphilus]|uniref:hypothetical protein n=1 Tax=Nitriliruptor alkaliphilus TaxID=427918 RepID=UPI0012EED463|nr:hypothetical protein [Nitriliruptor alkaliphilus]